MTTTELYTKGTKVWIPHPLKVWEGGKLLEDYSPTQRTLQVETDEAKEIKTLSIKLEEDLPYLKNPSNLVGENDLTLLSYLHEPAILYNLQVRFCQHKFIYTYCGVVLVAINPYSNLPIYDNDTIETYKQQGFGELDPHIFAVAKEAYAKLEREQMDQSIIISGESGAGKTVSAKHIMRYFASVCGNANETQIEKKVLASGPIMEAMGNAKTTRNDNSSRFGKFIELHFNKHYYIVCASIQIYLLEKSRVVFHATQERNYHIFYLLCAARHKFPDLKLRESTHFHYLCQSKSLELDDLNELNYFKKVENAFSFLGFSQTDQYNIFMVLSAVLHLGNIHFVEYIDEQGQERSKINEDDASVVVISKLLQIDEDDVRTWLCTKKFVSKPDTILKSMSLKEAYLCRDALAKYIYAQLFSWVVAEINRALKVDASKNKCIGVLDIYGHETFDINSFEQFCINYANEKLQQQFNLHVFKLEQEEYFQEEIEWKTIGFYDNQPCIELIEAKVGILSLLDEECKMPKGSDATWTEKLFLNCLQYRHFEKPRFETSAFIIKHFSDKVQYTSSGFLEKNEDAVLDEQLTVFQHSKNKFIRTLLSRKSPKTHKRSIGFQFKTSLNLLMNTLNTTAPHYVRCIKPNNYKSAFKYCSAKVVQQLRGCGILETVRISAAGFPSRWSYIDFFYRYRVLCEFKDVDKNNLELNCKTILKQYIKVPDMYQFGKTKIFLRPGQIAYLEKLRANKLKRCCVLIQSTVRGFICRKKYLRIRKCAINIQRYWRGYLSRKWINQLRKNKAAVVIQKNLRGWITRIKYRMTVIISQKLQNRARGFLARKRFMEMKCSIKATLIQKYVKGWLARKKYHKTKKQVVICQSVVRRFLARKLYRQLGIEARSIDHVKKQNKCLENTIISLQQKIEDLNGQQQNEVAQLRSKLDAETSRLNNLLGEKDKYIHKLESRTLYVQDDSKRQKLWYTETTKLRKDVADIIIEKKDYFNGRSRINSNELSNKQLEKTEPSAAESSFTKQRLDQNSNHNIGLILRLQEKVELSESIIKNLQKRLEDSEEESPMSEILDTNRLTHLEMKYSTVKKQLFDLTECIADRNCKTESEIDKKNKEIVELKSLLANQIEITKAVVNCSSKTGGYLNEDGELALAYDTQKRISKELYSELQKQKVKYKHWKKTYEIEIEKLQALIEKQQDALCTSFSNDALSPIEQFVQNQITELTIANLDLKDKNEKLTDTVTKLLKNVSNNDTNLEKDFLELNDEKHEPLERSKVKNYVGMFSFKKGTESMIMTQLVLGLKPKMVDNSSTCLPAYIVFMCLRYLDHINDKIRVQTLLSLYNNTVRKAVRRGDDDFETMALWLSNTLRLTNVLRQFSGNKTYQENSTKNQSEKCLKNIDISEHCQALLNTSAWIYTRMIESLYKKIQPLIISAILEHEEITGISRRSRGFKERPRNLRDESQIQLNPTQMLLQTLSDYYEILKSYGIDLVTISQIFKQVFYFMSSSSFNVLLLRKELCYWSKGLQIKYNLSRIEAWVREKQLDEQLVKKQLQPIMQAVLLLQARKSLEDVESICEMCSDLTLLQVCKILKSYTPIDDYEQKFSKKFILQVQSTFKNNFSLQEEQTLLKDVKFTFPVSFEFSPTSVSFEDVEIPVDFKLCMLQKL